MYRTILIFSLILAGTGWIRLNAQDNVCGTVFPETDPLEGISFKTADDDQIYEFNIFYTVLYLQPSDTLALSREWLQQETNITNTLFRLLNTDIVQVPEPYRSLATDVKVKFNFAGVRYVRSGNPAFPNFGSFFDPNQGGIPTHNPINTVNYYYAPYNWSTGVAVLPNSNVVGQPYHAAVTRLQAALSNTSNHYTAWVNVHELGHYFGLLHTFQGGCPETNCAIEGDRICDTPPCTQGTGCTNLSSGCGTATANRHNHMDYSDRITCAKMFTRDQSDKMRTIILAFYRNHITTPTTPPGSAPTCRITSPRDTTITPGSPIQIYISATDDKRVSYVELHYELANPNNQVEFIIENESMQVISDSVNYGSVFYRFTRPPYALGMTPYIENVYTFHAHAVDEDGLIGVSQEVVITVSKTPIPPPVTKEPILEEWIENNKHYMRTNRKTYYDSVTPQ